MANNQLNKLPNKSEAISISRNEVSSGKATSKNCSLVLVWPVEKKEGVAREMDFLIICTNSGKRAVDRRVIKKLRTQLVIFSLPLASRVFRVARRENFAHSQLEISRWLVLLDRV